MKVLLLDNYDSFTFNLFQLIARLDDGREPVVVRNDRISLEEIRALAPDRIVISPGPGRPENPAHFGVCGAVIRELGPRVPILGVCLGHLGLAEAFGGRIVSSEPCHGQSHPIHHDGRGLFRGLPSPLEAMRYHSLVVDPHTLPAGFEVAGRTGDGLIMALRHNEFPLYGLQFHPESIGTPLGPDLVAAFLSCSTNIANHY